MFTLVVRSSSLRIPGRAVAISSRLYSTSTMHDNDPDVLEKEKLRNLSRKSSDKTSTPHDHAPGWNEILASASEAAVKADKDTGSPSEMQSRTVEYLRAVRSENDGENHVSSTTATYLRDEVSGPLSDAQGSEEIIVKKKVIGGTVLDENNMTQSEKDVKADRGEI